LTALFEGVDENQATSPATGGALPGGTPFGVQLLPVLKSEFVVPFQSLRPSAGFGDGVGVGFGLPPLPQPLLLLELLDVLIETVCALMNGVAASKSRKASASDA
jgi:hypothetical protein